MIRVVYYILTKLFANSQNDSSFDRRKLDSL